MASCNLYNYGLQSRCDISESKMAHCVAKSIHYFFKYTMTSAYVKHSDSMRL